MQLREPPEAGKQLELFSAIFTDVGTRDPRETMEVPFLSLSKRPRHQPIRYSANGVEVTVSSNGTYGIANIWDWDLIMWLLSQLRHAIDLGHSVSRQLRFSRSAYLKAARRRTSGKEYRQLEDTIKRLATTSVETTIRAPAGSRTVIFHWLEETRIERDGRGHLTEAMVTLPQWLFEAVSDHRLVLSIHPDYFLLTGGFARWLYRFIRKGAGDNPGGWTWQFRTLFERSGTTQGYKFFAHEVRKIIKSGPLLDYELTLELRKGESYLHARRCLEAKKQPSPQLEIREVKFLSLKTTTYEEAKKIAPRLDIYALEEQWRQSTAKNQIEIRDPDRAFLGWLRKVVQYRRSE